jgi:hypothetical protein
MLCLGLGRGDWLIGRIVAVYPGVGVVRVINLRQNIWKKWKASSTWVFKYTDFQVSLKKHVEQKR